MGVKKLEELVTLQVALEMKLEIYRLVNEHPAAARDYKFRDQIFEAAKSVENNIADIILRSRHTARSPSLGEWVNY